MLNIAICDDDDLIAHQIESVLHNIGDEENVKIDTDVFYSGNDLVREISSGKKFDLIYMDIQMENGDTWSLAIRFDRTNVEQNEMKDNCEVVFLFDNAPYHLLKSGAEFIIYEGPHKVGVMVIR